MDSQQSGNTAPVKCRQCREPLDVPMVCQRCRSLQDADHADFFALLGIERSYDLDADALHQRFVDLSREVHPDYFTQQANSTQSLAMRNSAALNKAYRTLRDPLERAEYLLELAGGASSAQDRSVPPELLTEIMELREQVDHAKLEGRTETLALVRDQLLNQRCQIVASIASLARQVAQEAKAPLLSELRAQLNAISYVNNVLRQL